MVTENDWTQNNTTYKVDGWKIKVTVKSLRLVPHKLIFKLCNLDLNTTVLMDQ